MKHFYHGTFKYRFFYLTFFVAGLFPSLLYAQQTLVKGTVRELASANQVVCYCKDCQMYALFLGRESDILDEHGGTHVLQLLPKNVAFTQGTEALACVRLSENGLLRWYASCCKTPIG